MARQPYTSCVFINCPFDDEYKPIRDAIVFAIYDCGFIPRCALEENNGGNVRFDKIQKIIGECKFGVHDISRTELDNHNGLPRFNMPLELGVFLGAKRFGDTRQKAKNCLILDRDQYRYQQFISDIAGQDIRSHNSDAHQVIGLIRGWLSDSSGRRTIPGGRAISRRYETFLAALPRICLNAKLELGELTFNDFSVFASNWLIENGAEPA